MALAATAQHALAGGAPPDLIIGHGVMGRLLARLTLAAGHAAPTVWELNPARQTGAEGYIVCNPDDDARRNYRAIYDVSGDSGILDKAIARQAPGGEVVLAGFYKQSLSFAFAPAFTHALTKSSGRDSGPFWAGAPPTSSSQPAN